MGLFVIAMAPYDSRFMEHKPVNSDNTAVFRLMCFVLSSQNTGFWLSQDVENTRTKLGM